MEKSDFKIGQKVYLKIIKGSNAARYVSNDKTEDSESWIKEKIVTKIGKKYITVMDSMDSTYGEEKFDITQNFRHYYTVGTADYKLYLSKDEILEDMECEKLYNDIKSLFSSWHNDRKYTLDQLQKVMEILE